ncbi:VanZ family protein [Soonwooa sp.]|uniref:VanZ family protein n=1 Tax=Soonwooa sp. TaxID=1938592 RepID=UPI002608B264|nr:VanZ family protein [Soonwooa sp.]
MKRYYGPLLGFYTLFLLYMMFYGCGRIAGPVGYLQIHPFRTINIFFNSKVEAQHFAVNIIGNIVVFMPFGWMGLLSQKYFSFPKLLIGFPIAITIIELTQFWTHRGTADVDDLFLNTVGMILGYLLYSLVKFFYEDWMFEREPAVEYA